MKKKDKTNAKAMNALYKRAIGFYQEEEQISNYKGKMRTAVVMKYHPPDAEAARLWLEIKEKERI